MQGLVKIACFVGAIFVVMGLLGWTIGGTGINAMLVGVVIVIVGLVVGFMDWDKRYK